MKTRHAIFLTIIFVCLTVFSGEISFASEIPNMPTIFNARIGGFLGPSYSVKLKDGSLVYSASKGGQEIDSSKIIPTAAQWREFHDALNNLNVWQWRTNYINPDVLDGTQWSLEIKFEDQSLKTCGSNCYPKADGRPNGKPEFTKEFCNYLKAVKKLLGERTFE